jgi:hypothetical protein
VARTVNLWYRSSGQGGVPPIVNYITLSNLAWLKKPASASKLKLAELVALCAAALRPSKKTWDAFIAHLRKLEQEGTLTSDEAVAVVASGLTDQLLARVDDEAEIQQETFAAVVDRVRAAYQEEARDEIGKVKEVAAGEVERVRLAAEAEVSAVRTTSEHERRRLAAALQDQEIRATQSEERLRQVQLRILDIARTWANRTSGALTLGGIGVLVVGAAASLPGVLDGLSPFGRAMGFVAASILAGVGLLSLVRGGHIRQWRESLSMRLEARIRQSLSARYGVVLDSLIEPRLIGGSPSHLKRLPGETSD